MAREMVTAVVYRYRQKGYGFPTTYRVCLTRLVYRYMEQARAIRLKRRPRWVLLLVLTLKFELLSVPVCRLTIVNCQNERPNE